MFCQLPKVDMHKFNGLDPIGWVDQMEQHFSLHSIEDDMLKLRIGVMYIDWEH